MIFQDILENILTVYLIIGFGFFIAKKLKTNDDTFIFLRNVCYKFLFPLLLANIFFKYQIKEIITPAFFDFLIFISIAVFSFVLMVALHKKKLNLDRVLVVSFASSFTNSGFLGLSVVYLTFPKEYIVPAAVISFVFYFVSIILKDIVVFLDNEKINFELSIEFVRITIKKIITDPIIMLPLIALFMTNDSSRIVNNIDKVWDMVTNATYFLGLIIVGMSLRHHLKNSFPTINPKDSEFVYISLSLFIKLIAFPLIVIILCLFVNLTDMMKYTLVLQSAMPTGIMIVSSFNDDENKTKLINTIGVISTIISSVSVVVILLIAYFVF